jgi:hypothetical protein
MPRRAVGRQRWCLVSTSGRHRMRGIGSRLFAAFGFGPGWTVRCSDADGHRALVTVSVSSRGITLTSSVTGPVLFRPLEAGRLRAAVREALLAFNVPATKHDATKPERELGVGPSLHPRANSVPTPGSPVSGAGKRSCVRLGA